MAEQKVHTTPKDFFLQIGLIAALYVSAVSLLSLVFEIINYAFPDRLNYYADIYSSSMRVAVAALIVAFPVYIGLGWLFNREATRNPEKRQMLVRRWLTHLTLFIAGAAIAADLVVLIYEFLGGEITTRFVLKVLAVLVVAGLIFACYLLDLRRKGERTRLFNGFAIAATLVVLASIVTGFYVIGSPAKQRALRFDERRSQDLQSIQWQVVSYWQQKEQLPQNLSQLEDPISGFNVPEDPKTNQAYEYRVTGPLAFELCATFELPTPEGRRANGSVTMPIDMYGKGLDTWQHEAGRQCFTRTIDPDLYPSLKERSSIIR